MKKTKAKKTPLQKAIKFLSILIIVLIISVVAIVAGGWTYINSVLGGMNQEQIDESQIGIDEQNEENLKNYRNIALLGVDTRNDNYETYNNRSDCIIIASINERSGDVKLISIYRDTYLQIRENGKDKLDKITHAYAFGGAQNTLHALNTNLGLNIKEYVTVNFDAVIEAVDALGGITINIAKDEINYINDYIDQLNDMFNRGSKHITKTGEQKLDGIQALAYSRIRYTTGGDYKRTERMRTVLEAMVSKAKTLGLGQLVNLVNLLVPKISTNLSTGDIVSLIPTLLKVNFTESLGWPYTTEGITFDRWYGVPTTLESNVIRMHKEIFGNENYTIPEEIKTISDKIVSKTGYKEQK